MNPDNPTFRTEEEELRSKEYLRLKFELANEKARRMEAEVHLMNLWKILTFGNSDREVRADHVKRAGKYLKKYEVKDE